VNGFEDLALLRAGQLFYFLERPLNLASRGLAPNRRRVDIEQVVDANAEDVGELG
jgi:hypothetical protein